MHPLCGFHHDGYNGMPLMLTVVPLVLHDTVTLFWPTILQRGSQRLFFKSSVFDTLWNNQFLPSGSCLKIVYAPSAKLPYTMQIAVKKNSEQNWITDLNQKKLFKKLIVYYRSKTTAPLSTCHEMRSGEGYNLLHTSRRASAKILADRAQHELVVLWIIHYHR